MTGPGNVEVSVHVAASPESTFAYLTDPARYVQWMGSHANLEPVPGGTYRVQMADGFAADSTFTEIDPPRRLAFTWAWADDEAAQHVLHEQPAADGADPRPGQHPRRGHAPRRRRRHAAHAAPPRTRHQRPRPDPPGCLGNLPRPAPHPRRRRRSRPRPAPLTRRGPCRQDMALPARGVPVAAVNPSCLRPWPAPLTSVAGRAAEPRCPRAHHGRRRPGNAPRSTYVLVSVG